MESFEFTSEEGARVSLVGRKVHALERAIRGELLWPGHPEYDAARRLWNGLIDKRPGLIVRCASEADVVHAVNFARDHHLELAVRGGGHNVAGRALNTGGLVVDLSRMRRVQVFQRSRVVTSDGGAILGDVDAATLPLGLVTPLGLVPATGLAGFTLHGGYGFLSRRYGLSADNLLSARVVLADGRVVTASEEEDADLLWALRGGGGNFGVVTSFSHRLHPIEPEVTFSLLVHPVEASPGVMRFFADFMREAPDELTALATWWSAPALAEIPQHLHGAPVLILGLVHSGPPKDALFDLAPLRRLGAPIADLTRTLPFLEVQRFFQDDYPDGRLYYWKSMFLESLPDGVIARMAEAALSRPSSLSSVDVWALGGAVSRFPASHAAFAHRAAPFLAAIESNWCAAADTRSNIDWTREKLRMFEPFSKGAQYLNFAGLGEGGEALVRGAYGGNLERLREVKARCDPENLFRGNFNISPH